MPQSSIVLPILSKPHRICFSTGTKPQRKCYELDGTLTVSPQHNCSLEQGFTNSDTLVARFGFCPSTLYTANSNNHSLLSTVTVHDACMQQVDVTGWEPCWIQRCQVGKPWPKRSAYESFFGRRLGWFNGFILFIIVNLAHKKCKHILPKVFNQCTKMFTKSYIMIT